jgi:hypothetical protein
LLKHAFPLVPPGSRHRRARHPVPPSQVVEVFGTEELALIADRFQASYRGRHVRWSGGGEDEAEQRVLILDVDRYLQAEVEAATVSISKLAERLKADNIAVQPIVGRLEVMKIR